MFGELSAINPWGNWEGITKGWKAMVALILFLCSKCGVMLQL